MSRIVTLQFSGDLNRGSEVTLKWGNAAERPEGIQLAQLPANPTLNQTYCQWQQAYRSLEELYRRPRLELEPDQTVSWDECDVQAAALEAQLNQWFNHAPHDFQRLSRQLTAELSRHPNSQVLIQTDEPQLQRLPWHLWQLLKHHASTELILSPREYQPILRTPQPRCSIRIRILAVLGDSHQINVQIDRQLLQALPNLDPASCFLEKPTRRQLVDALQDSLGWDILFFAGHSCSERDSQIGRIHINDTESLTLDELPATLTTATEKGLKLAIFNSCDGLGLINSLSHLQIPQILVMREPVPDEVAHRFLEVLLHQLSQGSSLSQSVKAAREQLEAIQDKLPYATWLPLLYKHPAAPALNWQQYSQSHTRASRQRMWLLRSSIVRFISLAIAAFMCVIVFQLVTEASNLGDYQSEGEEILNTTANSRAKQNGVRALRKCHIPIRNYLTPWHHTTRQAWQNCILTPQYPLEALKWFEQSWQETKDPETLIYLNNAFLQSQNLRFDTIAVAVPLIHSSQQEQVIDSKLADEILRGVAQAQTEINLGLPQGRSLAERLHLNPDALPPKPFKSGVGLKVVIVDDANRTKKATSKAQALAKRSDVMGLVGHYASELTTATVETYGHHQLVTVSPGSTTEELTQPKQQSRDPHPYFFRTIHTTGDEASVLVDYLTAQSKPGTTPKAVVLYNPDSPYTHSFWREFKRHFEGQGGTVQNSIDLSAPDFESQAVIELVQDDPEITIVLIPDGQVSNALDNALRVIQLNQGKHLIVGPWGLYGPKILALRDPKLFENFVISAPWSHLSSPEPDFAQSAIRLWGGPVSTRTAPAYDAARVLIYALAQQQRPSRSGTHDVIASPNFEIKGATGTVEFDQSNRKNPHLELLHVLQCSTQPYGLAFIPTQLSASKVADLSCKLRSD